MAETVQVKGSTLRTKLEFARTHLGPEVEEALRTLLEEAAIHRVLEASWYDYAIYEHLLEKLAEVAYGGDLARLREVGTFSANHALGTTYQAFAQGKDLDRFLEVLPQLHPRLHSHGRLTLEERTATSFVLAVRDTPRFHRGDAYVTEGFFAACAGLLGCQGVRSSMSRDGEGVCYRITFTHHTRPRA